jgi:hypothetical protein
LNRFVDFVVAGPAAQVGYITDIVADLVAELVFGFLKVYCC